MLQLLLPISEFLPLFIRRRLASRSPRRGYVIGSFEFDDGIGNGIRMEDHKYRDRFMPVIITPGLIIFERGSLYEGGASVYSPGFARADLRRSL